MSLLSGFVPETNPRYIELQEKQPITVYNQMTSYTVEAPTEDKGPPGYYMLFAITKIGSNHAPSVAQFIKLQ